METETLSEKNKIHVQGLHEESTDTALSEHFGKYGRVVKATVAMDGLTGKPKDFGYVWFANEDSAKAAVEDVEEHMILGTKVQVKEAINREPSPIQDIESANGHSRERIEGPRHHSKKIFVGGLPPDLTEEDFKIFFQRFGQTTDVVIIVDRESRRSRGFGFVTYESEESARTVLQTSRYVLNDKEVEVKAAIPKEMTNTRVHPNVHYQQHPSSGAMANGFHHDSTLWLRHGMNGGLMPYLNAAPIYPYANCMVTTSPAYAYGMATAPFPAYANSMFFGFPAYNGYTRTEGNKCNVTPRPFTKVRISKPPSINGESSSPSRAKDPSPAPVDSKLNGCPSPAPADSNLNGCLSLPPADSNLNGSPSSVEDDGKVEASTLSNDW